MMNYIENSIAHGVTLHMTRQAAEVLKQYKPKDCPFKDYTLFDLVCDLMDFSWRITDKIISLANYIRMLQKENYVHAVVYGDDIIKLIEEV